jgi:uncharacterized membrane protein
MKKFLIYLIFFSILLSNYSTALVGDCTIIVAENGNSFVIITLEGEGTVDLPLPLDVNEPEIEGALYVQTEDGIELSIGSTQYADIAYQTSLFTEKTQDEWNFYMHLPEINFLDITLSLPENAIILNTKPLGVMKQEEGSKNIYWELREEDAVNVTYKFSISEITTTTTIIAPTTTISSEKEKGEETYYWAISFIMIALIAIAAYYFQQRKKQQQKIKSTDGMLNIIRTLTENERKVVEILLEHGGELRRNDLGKISKISKSSLSVALHNLENKNIVEIDRTFTVHNITLTEWFKSR